MSKRDTQFRGYANALHKELVAIHYEGFTNNWTSVDIDRRVIQAIARHAYDLALHTTDKVRGAISSDPTLVLEHNVPDMTELPKEEMDI